MTITPTQSDKADALIYSEGLGSTVYIITALTDAAREWIDGNVQSEGYQWLSNSLCVEHGFIADIVQGMITAGLTVW